MTDVARRMSWTRALGTALVWGSVIASPAIAKTDPEPPDYFYGDPPGWDRFKELGESAVRNILIDPDSARFEWPYGYRQGGWKLFLGRMIHGYTACGYVNARNRMGGYTGRSFFVVVIDRDRVLHADIGKSGSLDFVSNGCSEGIKRRMFPAVTAMIAKETPVTDGETIWGFRFLPTQDGALVVAVEPGKAAAIARLRGDTLITHVNGIGLAGLGDAMSRLFSAAGDSILLRTRNDQYYQLKRAAASNEAEE